MSGRPKGPVPCLLIERWNSPKDWADCKNCEKTVKFTIKRSDPACVSGIWCARRDYTRVPAEPHTPVPLTRGVRRVG